METVNPAALQLQSGPAFPQPDPDPPVSVADSDESERGERPAPAAVSRSGAAVHPLVRLDFGVRLAGHWFTGFAYASALLDRGQGGWLWALLCFTTVAWPFAAYALSVRAADSKAAELRCLLVDSVICGVWVALIGFHPWIGLAFLVALTTADVAVGGERFALRCLLAAAAGLMLGGGLNGFAVGYELSLRTHVIAAAAVALFALNFGLRSHQQATQAYRARQDVRERNRVIEQQTEALERARRVAERDRAAAEEAREQAEEARAQAETANRTKSAFLANMSHELRTPLNAVIGYAEMIEEDLAELAGSERMRSDLGRIRSAARHLLGLINDVLDLSKVEAGKIELHPEPIEVSELVDLVASTAQPLVNANANVLELRVQPRLGVLRTDATRLRQVLYNLLSNAAKFTRQGRIVLAVNESHNAHGRPIVVFEVRDTGIGMSAEQMERLFQPFVQASAETSRQYGGTGLGLAISRRLCRMMGGDLEARSEAGQGSTFRASVLRDFPTVDAQVAQQWHERKAAARTRDATGHDGGESRRLYKPPALTAAELQDERVRELVQGAPVFLILWRAGDSRILLAGPRSQELFGYQPLQLVGLSMQRLYAAHSVDGEALSESLRAQGHASGHELRFLRADGSEFWGRVSAHALDYDGRTCLIAGVVDISDLRQAQAATEAASAAKTRFLSNMGHAMRTPLTDIIGYADWLLEAATPHAAPTVQPVQAARGDAPAAVRSDAGGGDPHYLQLAAGRIRESGHTLLSLIDAVLDHASLEQGELAMRLEPVPLRALVAEVETAARPACQRRANSLGVDPGEDACRVLADPTRLKQLLLAVISHANRVVAGPGPLRIFVAVRRPQAGWVEVQVRDDGPGLSPAALRQALSPFHGVQGPVAPADGDIGLRLALACGLAERMGGRFEAESDPARGSRYSIHLPLAGAPEAGSPAEALETHDGQDPAR